MSDRITILLEQFCRAIATDIASLEKSLDAAEPAGVQAALHKLHKIKGAGGSYGFHRLSTVAAELEHTLKSHLGAGHEPSETTRRAAQSFERLKRTASELSPQDSTLFGLDLATLGSRTPSPAAASTRWH